MKQFISVCTNHVYIFRKRHSAYKQQKVSGLWKWTRGKILLLPLEYANPCAHYYCRGMMSYDMLSYSPRCVPVFHKLKASECTHTGCKELWKFRKLKIWSFSCWGVEDKGQLLAMWTVYMGIDTVPMTSCVGWWPWMSVCPATVQVERVYVYVCSEHS